MKMRRYIGFCLLIAGIVSAQPPVPHDLPIIIGENAELYALAPDGSTEKLTRNPNDGRSTLNPSSGDDLFPAPDNTHLIWRDTPRFFEQAFNNGELGNIGSAPVDLLLLDYSTGETTRIAAHADLPALAPDTRLYYRESYSMSWSPDGAQFAYIEIETVRGTTITDEDVRLQVYDLANGQTQTLVQPVLQGVLYWLSSGIAVVNGRDVFLYAQDGALLAQTRLGSRFSFLNPLNPVWVGGEAYLAIEYSGQDLEDEREMTKLFDPLTGDYLAAGGVVASVAAAAPETSLRLMGGGNDNRARDIRTAGGEVLWTRPTEAPFPNALSLSMEGDQFVLYLSSTPRQVLFGDASGEITSVEYQVRGIDWGALIVTVVGVDGAGLAPLLDAPEGSYTRYMCGTDQASPLTPGALGRVLPGSANRLRAEPDRNAEIIGEIPGGEVFSVLEGRQGVCRGGVRWAQVEYDGMTGWTAENLGDEMFVEAAD